MTADDLVGVDSKELVCSKWMQHAVCPVSVAKRRFRTKRAGESKKASKDAGVTK